ncbi:MAG: ABC transporter ATP-binding protein [Candidatus Eisenbacteria bacterium]|nr:ABC transporter ATP-binding protein [Candidatus Eisenbacteria bacterium]
MQRAGREDVAGESAPCLPGSIEARGISKTFRRRRRGSAGLAPVTLDVGPGEVCAIVGPNGCGKTTALRILAGLATPSSGRALLCGHDVVADPGAAYRLVGLSLGSVRSFYWRLTAGQNLAFFGRLAGMRGRAIRDGISELAAALGLESVVNEPVRFLSRGALARLSVARALLPSRPVALLDEPLSAVDAQGRAAIVETLRSAAGGGAAILVTAQEREEVVWCDRIYAAPTG